MTAQAALAATGLAALSDDAREAWGNSFMAAFPPRVTRALLAGAREERLPPSAVLHGSHDGPFDGVGLVVEGLLRIFRESPDGREATVRYAAHGDVVGLVAAVSGVGDVGVQAIAGTRILWLPADHLATLARVDPEVAWAVTGHLAELVHRGQELLAEDVFLSVRARVTRHLLDLAERDGDHLLVRASQQMLADAIGSVREVVARVLKTLAKEGLVERRGSEIVLLDPSSLHAISSGARRRCRRRAVPALSIAGGH
jgi:CRP-like cAMP-binding protein